MAHHAGLALALCPLAAMIQPGREREKNVALKVVCMNNNEIKQSLQTSKLKLTEKRLESGQILTVFMFLRTIIQHNWI